MLSYPIPEAEELLSNKLNAAQQSLSNCEEDLDFLREQVTVRAIISLTSLHALPSGSRQRYYDYHHYRPLTSLPLRQWKSPQRESTTGTFPKSAKRRRKREQAAKRFSVSQLSHIGRSKSQKIVRKSYHASSLNPPTRWLSHTPTSYRT
jgi:hypothetical protein